MAIAARKPSGTAPPLQRFRISWGQFGNRCRECPGLALLRAVILDFRPRFANHCRDFPGNSPATSVILDSGLRFGNHCTAIATAVRNDLPVVVVAAAIFRVRLHSSLPRKKMARLQRLLRRRSSASDSILRCRKESGSACRPPLPKVCSDS